jgi:signal transduction histidine kinase
MDINSSARGEGATSPSPNPTVAVGHVYLDVTRRILHCLNEVARQLQRGGLPFTPADLANQPLFTLGGEAVKPADLPLVVAWREKRPVEAVFVRDRRQAAAPQVLWTAAPLFDDAGEVSAVVGTVMLRPPEPDWQLLAGLAHDLRTPLQTLKFLVEVLGDPSLPRSSIPEALERLRSTAERAQLIGRDLLEWCRVPVLSGRRVQPAWFSLAPCLRNLVAEQSLEARKKGLEVRTDLEAVRDTEICSDELRFGRILLNLLSNAVRYTTSGYVGLVAAWEGDSPRDLVLSVVDSGTGLTQEERESIFQPYHRGQAGRDSDSGGSASGSGVGLAVVDRLVEELGLSLRLQSELGSGSTFRLRIPGSLTRQAAPTEPGSRPA